MHHFCISYISVSSLPFKFLVMLPAGCIFTTLPALIFCMYSTCDFVSVAGRVEGMVKTPVNPPLAAANIPVCISSFHSNPGSPKLTRKSKNPGETCSPFSSIISAPLGIFKFLPIFGLFLLQQEYQLLCCCVWSWGQLLWLLN